MPPSTEANAEPLMPDRLPSPRRSLQTKAIVAVAALVALSTTLAGYLTQREATAAMEQALVRDTAILAETASHLFESHIDDSEATPERFDRVLLNLLRDSRISFMVITDAAGRVLAHRYNEPLAWHDYQAQLTPQERQTPLTLNRSIRLQSADGLLLVVRRQLIHQPPRQGGAPSTSRIGGYIEMGMQDAQQARLVANLREATISVVAAICMVCLPLVIWWVRGWTTPLRQMVAAALRLGMGSRAEQVDIERDDEIGLLGRAFNAMSVNLTSIQQALVEANADLEQKVAHRTRQLEQANQQLEREMSEKDQFLRAVSHDLGAPLRNIEGLTGMLMLKHRAEMPEDVLVKLERIAANAKTESELITELMELSRIKTRPGKRIAVNLNEVVQSITETLSYELEQKQIELRIDTPLPTIHAERNRMRQVFQNLIDNAIKYMPPEAPVKAIHIGWAWEDGERVFHVKDTGFGIPPQEQTSIFQVFRRGKQAGRTETPGRGVGLASVKAIIECYGGRIRVESRPPRGATFHFTFAAEHILGVGEAQKPALTQAMTS